MKPKKFLTLTYLILFHSFLYAQNTLNTVWFDGFENDKGWTLSGEFERNLPGGNGGINYGNPDPSSAYMGKYVIGTDLTGDGDYSANTTSIATSPVIDCSNYTSVQLELYYWLNVEDATYDQATIEVYDGTNWQIVGQNASGSATTNSTWNKFTKDVSSYAVGNANFQIRIKLVSDGGWQYSGWNIDNVTLKADATCPVFTEDFESYTAGNLSELNDGVTKQWVQITNVASTNNWAIGTASGAISGTNGLTINNGSADASYDNSDDAQKTAYYYSKIDARNYKDLKINMNWKADGEAGADYGKIGYSTNASIIYYSSDVLSGQASSTNTTFDFSTADEKNFYFGFTWYNDGNSTGNNPALTVDDITLKGTPYFNYSFSTGNTVYSHISGTILSFDANGGANLALPADFNFNYLGTVYDNIRVSKYGWIHFYDLTPAISSAANTNDLISANFKPLIAPLWDDLSMDGQSAVIYKVQGSSPNRIFIIEYRDMLWGGIRANFQVKLYETTHVIEFIYGDIQSPSNASASIGINGMCQTSFMSVTPALAATVSMDTPNNAISSSTYLTSGTVYTFAPYALQPYHTMQGASLLIGQVAWNQTSTNIATTDSGRIHTPGASSSAVSAKNVLVVGSRTHHRVLLWNSIPTTNGAPADIVLGQPDFISSDSAAGNTGLGGVTALAFSPDGNKLLVADGTNNRILIWNSIPTSNGQAADVVVGQPDFSTTTAGTSASKMNYPTGIYVTISGKLIVTEFKNNRVLIFNKIPTTNGTSADVVIGQSSFTTNSTGNAANQMDGPWDAGVTPDGRLLISDDNNNRILIFNQIPTTNGASADLVIGQTGFGLSTGGTSASQFKLPNVTVSPEGKLACGDYGNNRVLIFNRVPSVNGASADEVLGQDAFTEAYKYSTGTADGTPDSLNMYHPYSVNFDLNGRLLVNGRDMNRVMLFGESPTDTSDLVINISSSVEGSTVCIGSPVTLTITISNNGPDMAQNVVAKAALPANFSYISSSFTAGSYNYLSGFWTIPAIPQSASYTLTIKGTIQTNSGGSETITAYANITSTLEVDDDFSNNSDYEVFTISANHAPTLTTTNLTDIIVPINGSTGARSFGITDADGDAITLSHASSNTTLVPNDDTHITISAISSGSSDIDVTPATDKYGYARIQLIATDANGCQASDTFKVSVGNLWEGDYVLDNTKWNQADNWSGGIPSNTLEAIIPSTPKGGNNFPVINADATCEKLIIESGAKLTLNDGYKLDTYGDIIIQSDANQTGSFVDMNTQANLDAGKGLNLLGSNQNITVERYIANNAWHYVSPALSNVNSDVFTKVITAPYFNPNFYYYDETNVDADWKQGWMYAYNNDGNHTGISLTKGQGYAFTIGSYGGSNVSMTGGTLNSGDISIAVSHTTGSAAGTAKEGWNLIGNPYPSGLNADEFINLNATTNSVIDGTLYYWDEPGTSGFGDNSSLYAYYNSTGYVGSGSGSVVPDLYISSGQGFFVHVSGSGGNVQFKNSMREKENSYFFKRLDNKPQMQKIALAMKNPEGRYNELLVALSDETNDKFDPQFDAYKLRDSYAYGKFAFYSLMDTTEMAIQALEQMPADTSKEIHLGYETSVGGLHKIYLRSIEHLNDQPVYLIDYLNQVAINLKKQRSYLFQSEAGKFNQRFVIHIGSLENIEETKTQTKLKISDDDIYVFAAHKQIILQQNKQIFEDADLKVYDIAGRLVARFDVNNNPVQQFNLPESTKLGVYIIQINDLEHIFKQKVFIQ